MKQVLLAFLILNSCYLFSQHDRPVFHRNAIEILAGKDIPLNYDLREFDRVSPVKTQADGACWASAAMSTVESAWLSSDYLNEELSAINLKLYHGFVDERSTYGNHYMATAYFSRGDGPLIQSPDSDSLYQFHPQLPACISDARFLPNNPDLIKSTIMQNGGVYSMMYFRRSLLDTLNFSYFSEEKKINHAVMLIGWNDTIQNSGGQGAWLAQNSLGKKFGDMGYFWISYRDENILNHNAVWNGWLDYNAKGQFYYYDTLGSYHSYGFRDSTCYGLVKYTAEEKMNIEAIGTSINFPNSKIESWIFREFDDSLKVLSGPIGKTDPENCVYPGYYTIKTQLPIAIEKGEDFYVMIKYVTPNDTLPLPVETYIEGYSEPLLTSGKCWINPDYSKWPATWYECGANSPYQTLKFNLCIKVYGVKQQ